MTASIKEKLALLSRLPGWLRISIPLFCLVCTSYWLWPRTPENLFPVLPSGSYIGGITGMSTDRTQSVSVYVERIENTAGLLMVLFEPGWRARFVPLFVPDGTGEDETPVGYLPLSMEKTGRRYELFGQATASGYSGTLALNGLPIGQWALQPVSAKELRVGSPSFDEDFNFIAWLRTKGNHRLRLQELADVSAQLDSAYANIRTTSEVIDEQHSLKRVSGEYYNELEQEVKELRSQDAEYKKRVNELVRELEQLRRITKGGRSIELARRVVKRENKWYQVNWSQGEDLSALEETLAASQSIDLRKLNERHRQALEIKRLKNQVAQERAKIQKLKRQFDEKLKGEKEKKKEEKKPWWRRLDTVFG